MINHLDHTEIEFIKAFQDCSLPPTVFNHEAHLRLAWLYLTQLGLDNTILSMQNDLKNYVAHWGASDKYNTTLTIASIHAVHHFLLKSKSNTFSEFITEFPRLKYQFKEVLACHYKTDIFNNKSAKQVYLEPELLPFY